jgi:hypothetical protein
MTTFAFVAEGFDGSWQKIPHAGFQMKSTSNVEEPTKTTLPSAFGSSSPKTKRNNCVFPKKSTVFSRNFAITVL